MKNWDQINEKLDFLRKKQIELNLEIEKLTKEVNYAKQANSNPDEIIITESKEIIEEKFEKVVEENIQINDTFNKNSYSNNEKPNSNKKNIDYERFIGENLINKIGILVLIIGVAIGAKFAIDRDLISPLFRIILGYGFGLGLLLVSQKLMKKYETFSSVLLSGSSSILYFVSFFAYDEYQLIGIEICFILLFLVTVFTSIAAIKFDKKIIASLGLIGAYLIPFLLSTGSNNYHFLFSYLLIVNLGLFFILLKRDWKIIKVLGLISTWIICVSWTFLGYEIEYFYSVILYFTSIYLLFNFAFILQKVLNKIEFSFFDFIIIGLNPVIYFIIGLNLIDRANFDIEFSGIFALILAILQIPNILITQKSKLENKNIQIFTASIIILFATIAIPLQLDGVWISMFWALEAGVFYLLWARTQNHNALRLVNVFLSISLFNLLINGFSYQNDREISRIIFNSYFLNNLIVSIIAAYIVFERRFKNNIENVKFFRIEISQILLGIILFYTGSAEISKFWNIIIHENTLSIYQGYYNDYIHHPNYKLYKSLTLNIFHILFLLFTFYFLQKKNKPVLGEKLIFIFTLSIYFLLFARGLFILSELRENFLDSYNFKFFSFSKLSWANRYLVFLIDLSVLTFILKIFNDKSGELKRYLSNASIYFLFITWYLSSELLNIIDLLGLNIGYKGPLSILWGILALAGIIYGFKRKEILIRWASIILLAVTLFKLFIFDLTSLSNISKTIIFISVGIILLIISFIYNKIKKDVERD